MSFLDMVVLRDFPVRLEYEELVWDFPAGSTPRAVVREPQRILAFLVDNEIDLTTIPGAGHLLLLTTCVADSPRSEIERFARYVESHADADSLTTLETQEHFERLKISVRFRRERLAPL